MISKKEIYRRETKRKIQGGKPPSFESGTDGCKCIPRRNPASTDAGTARRWSYAPLSRRWGDGIAGRCLGLRGTACRWGCAPLRGAGATAPQCGAWGGSAGLLTEVKQAGNPWRARHGTGRRPPLASRSAGAGVWGPRPQGFAQRNAEGGPRGGRASALPRLARQKTLITESVRAGGSPRAELRPRQSYRERAQ